MKTEKGNIMVVVKVAPYGVAEKSMMDHWKEIKEKFHMIESHLYLGAIIGKDYNLYTLDFATETDFWDAFDYLRDLFWDIQIDEKYDFLEKHGELIPEVFWMRDLPF